MRRLLITAAAASFLAACTTTPAPVAKTHAKKANTVSRLPTQPVPALKDRPAFGSPEFNAIKDAAPEVAVDVSQVPDAVPAEEPRAKSGNKDNYTVLGETYKLLPTNKGFSQTGRASWYGKKFHGNKTASGERYDMYAMTAAHRNLPLPTYIRVTNKANGKSVIVKVNDRGPFHGNRVLDLSYAAASKLDMLKHGTATVKIEALDPSEFQRELSDTGKPQEPAKIVVDENEQYFVQVGAFGGIDNATALQSRLLGLVYAPVVITQDGALNRVQVGPFANREEAEKMSGIIRDGALGDPRIVSR